MSVSANDRRYGPVTLSGAGETVSADFRIQADADALVWFLDSSAGTTYAALTLNTDYTIANKTSSGFDVVLGAAVGASGDKVIVLDKESTATKTSFNTGDSLPPTTLQSQGLDYLHEKIQRLEEIVGRALQLPPESTKKTTPDQTTITTQVPDYSASDASKVLALNAAGDAMVWSTPTDASAITVTSFAETLLDDTTAAAARTTLGVAIGTDVADEAETIHRDGSVAFTGDQSMGSNKLTNVTDPTAAQDAATMNYVDTQLAATHYADPDTYRFWSEDFIALDDNAPSTASPIAGGILTSFSGSGATVSRSGAADSAHPGIIDLQTGTTTTGKAGIFAVGEFRVGGGELTLSTKINIDTLADGTDDYDLWFGMAGSGSALLSSVTDGIYFKYDRDASANWLICAQASSTETATDSLTAVATGWITLKIVVNAVASSVEFFIDGSSVGTVTANIPTATDLQFGLVLDKEAGTTDRKVQCDIVWFKQTMS